VVWAVLIRSHPLVTLKHGLSEAVGPIPGCPWLARVAGLSKAVGPILRCPWLARVAGLSEAVGPILRCLWLARVADKEAYQCRQHVVEAVHMII
jgi:hypothetical protein